MKDRVNQLFRDKFVLVMLVLGLLVVVAAAGAVTIRKGNRELEESPYLEIQEPDGMISENETAAPSVAGNSNAEEPVEEADADAKGHTGDDLVYQAEETEPRMEESAAEAGAVAESSLALDYSDAEKLMWPVQGNVILGYSMDTTTYFPTLEQYKCNPANIIQSDISMPVLAPTDAKVLEIGTNEEIGNYVKLDLGNEYTAVCGQLKEIPVVENEYLHGGDTIGYIAEPTKYYAVEGVNLYFELLHGEQPVDALDYLE